MRGTIPDKLEAEEIIGLTPTSAIVCTWSHSGENAPASGRTV